MSWSDSARRLRVALALIIVGGVACSSPTRPSPTPVTPAPSPRPALSVACPANTTAASPNGSPVAVSYPVPVVSGGPVGSDGLPSGTISCAPASGALFQVGTNEVRCTATAGTESASCSFSITVTAPAPQLLRTRFLAFGDSMTAGEVTQPTSVVARDGTPNLRLIVVPSAAYPTRLLTHLRGRYTGQVAQIEITNAGRVGEWAEDGALRLPGVMSTLRPQAVLLLQGNNDLSALGDPGLSRAARAIDTMAQEVRGRGARLFLATLPPTRPNLPRSVSPALIDAFNARIRTTARGEGAVLVDLYTAVAADLTRFIGPDGVHPTVEGYQRIADVFFAAIIADLEARTQ